MYTECMRKRGGFTLIELIITISVIALLTVLSAMYYATYTAKSKLSRVSSELSTLATSMSLYAEDNDHMFPSDVSRGLPPGLEKYLPNNQWPTSVWPHGSFDYDTWPNGNQQVYQISYHTCGIGDPVSYCRDAQFPTFVNDSSIFYCISGPCIPHSGEPNIPGYCVNCQVKKLNY
jgi:prepilin-type N-terminal cleavage/methylation domain-containing protein